MPGGAVLKEVFTRPDLPICVSIINKTDTITNLVIPHFHEAFELMKIIKGPVHVQLGARNFMCNTGDIIFVPSMMTHEVYADTADKKLFGLIFDSDKLNFAFTNYNFKTILDKNLINQYIFTPEHEKYSELNTHLINAVVRYTHPNISYKTEVGAHAALVLSLLVNIYMKDFETIPNNMFYKIQSITEYIDAHYSEKLYISDLSSMLGVCDDHFIRIFKETTQKTPNQYIQEVRINNAMLFIISSTLSLREIAEKVGFSSYAHFCSVFKSKTLTSPHAYRKKFKEDAASKKPAHDVEHEFMSADIFGF